VHKPGGRRVARGAGPAHRQTYVSARVVTVRSPASIGSAMGTPTGPLLAIDDLKTWFCTRDGLLLAVDGLSYQIDTGEMRGIVGESGCGKSVSALSILGLIPMPPGRIVGGSIRFRGRELVGLEETQLRGIRGNDISVIFQEPMTSLNP